MATTLVENRQELEAKQAKLAKAIEEAGDALDFTKVKSIDGETTEAKIEAFRALNDECADLAAEVERENLKSIATDVKGRGELMKRPVKTPTLAPEQRLKSLGEMFVESEQFKEFRGGKGEAKTFAYNADMELKSLFETGAGWAPQALRTGRVVEAVTRPIQILDLIPTDNTEQSAVVYMEETTRTHSAAERAEGGTYAEDAYELVERSSQVRSIGTSLPITDEQLEDVGQSRSYVDGRLTFGVRQRLDGQVINGNGTAPNLRGILQVVGIQTQAKGADPTFDTFHKALTKIRVTGRAFPNGAVLHPNDWESIRLTRTADGIYIMGNPAEVGPMQLFGIPIALSDAIAENTGLVGDFANHCQLFNRRGIQVEVGYVNTQFNEGKRTIRANTRVAFVVYRPAAFCTITGI